MAILKLLNHSQKKKDNKLSAYYPFIVNDSLAYSFSLPSLVKPNPSKAVPAIALNKMLAFCFV